MIGAALEEGIEFSLAMSRNRRIDKAIAAIPDNAWSMRLLACTLGAIAIALGATATAPASADPVGAPGVGPSPIFIGIPPWSTAIGQAWPTAESGVAQIRVVADAGFSGNHAELDVRWLNVNTGACGAYHVSPDFPVFSGRWDERLVNTGSGTVIVAVTGVLTALQGVAWAPHGAVAPIVTPGVYGNSIP